MYYFNKSTNEVCVIILKSSLSPSLSHSEVLLIAYEHLTLWKRNGPVENRNPMDWSMPELNTNTVPVNKYNAKDNKTSISDSILAIVTQSIPDSTLTIVTQTYNGEYGKCSNISNALLFLFKNKMLVIRAGNHNLLFQNSKQGGP